MGIVGYGRPARATSGDGVTRAMGPTPNAGVRGRIVRRTGRAPPRLAPSDRDASGRGSRACTPSLVAGARHHATRADRARVHRTATLRHAMRCRAVHRPTPAPGRPWPADPCDNPPDDDPARPPGPPTSDLGHRRAVGPPPSRPGPRDAVPGSPRGPHADRAASRGIPLVGPDRCSSLAVVGARRPASCTSRSGGAGRVVAGLSVGTTLTGFVDGVTATASRRARRRWSSAMRRRSSRPTSRTPSRDTVDLVVTVPAAVVGDPDAPDPGLPRPRRTRQPAPIKDVPIGRRPAQDSDPGRALTKGINDFIGHDRRRRAASPSRRRSSATSSTTTKPKITITSPKASAVVNGKSVRIKGKTQGRSTLSAPATTTNGDSIVGHGRRRRDVHPSQSAARDRAATTIQHRRDRPGRATTADRHADRSGAAPAS